MTDEQSRLVSVFEDKVHQLMLLCENLKQENDHLKLQIADLKRSQSGLEQENNTIKAKYDNLKMARIIAVKQDDFKGAKSRLSQLVKEVDKCIALLNG